MSIPSYEMFNYNFRPAKAIERKIFLDILKEIYGASPGDDCSYIGLGSIFFADFRMIHKELSINSMINIEKNESDKVRFEFNKPFKCIKLVWGSCTEVLPTLNWNGRKIIWMDYDEKLQNYMFEDLDSIFSNIEPGSFYFFTCNSTLSKYENKKTRIYETERFINDFEAYAPLGIKPKDLTAARTPYLIREMLIARINRLLSDRNSMVPKNEQLMFSQVLNIKYQDGAPMYSFGGYIVKSKDLKSFQRNSFHKLPFVSSDEKVVDIKSPIITSQEIDIMNSFLPHKEKAFMRLKKLSFIPEEEKLKYFRTYRHYPFYAELRN